jgi:hypothetical protein
MKPAFLYAHLLVAQAINEIASLHIKRDFCQAARAVAVQRGHQRSDVLIEEDGLMLMFLTIWKSREDALRFGSSGLHNLVLVTIDAHVVGSPVVKLFRLL